MENGRKPKSVRLQGETLTAFQRLRSIFQKALILVHFDPEKPIILETDTLNFAIGAIVSQVANNNQKHSIIY